MTPATCSEASSVGGLEIISMAIAGLAFAALMAPWVIEVLWRYFGWVGSKFRGDKR